jgi:Resolvase, N terminal domain
MGTYGYILGNAKKRREQSQRISSYCKAFGLHLEKIFSDTLEQKIAFAQREGVNNAINVVKPGDTILVTSLDIIMGSLEDAQFGLKLVRARQIDLIAIDLNTSIFSSALFVKTIELLHNEYDKSTLGNLSGTMYAGGSPPYGYQVVGGVLHAVEDEHLVINTIIKFRRQGNSLRAISEKLVGEGTVLSHKAIERIIHRESDLS